MISLQSVIETLDSSKLILFPQVFWVSVAMLDSNYHYEFLQAVSLISELVDRIDFDDESSRAVFMSKLPEKWTPNFLGLQPKLLKGLAYSKTEPQTLQLLTKLHHIRFDQLVDPTQGRLLFAVLASLPSILGAEDDEEQEISQAYHIAALAERKNQDSVAKWFKSMSSPFPLSLQACVTLFPLPHRCKLDISKKKQNMAYNIKQLMELLKPEFFPKYDVEALHLLFQLVGHGQKSYRKPVLMMLLQLLPFVNMKQPKLAQYNVPFIGFLFTLLKSDCSEEALGILELLMKISGVDSLALTQNSNIIFEGVWNPEEPWWDLGPYNQGEVRNNLGHVVTTCNGNTKTARRTSKLINSLENKHSESMPRYSSSSPPPSLFSSF